MTQIHPAGTRRLRTRAALLSVVVVLVGAVAIMGRNASTPGVLSTAAAQPLAATTQWCAISVEIHLAQNGPCSASSPQFFAKGVNYEPTQAGGSANFSPYNDLLAVVAHQGKPITVR